MYHRFGEDNYPSTNISLDQFEDHIKILKQGPYTIWPVEKIVEYIKSGKELPDYTVGITVDDAAASVYEQAWPRFKKAGIPFTLFVTTDDIDRNSKSYMNWDQLRELQKNGLVTIGNHTKSHAHMYAQSDLQNAQEIIGSQKRFADELGMEPKLFAYPYGEFSNAATAVVKRINFIAAFGQHSGVTSRQEDIYQLPRFSLNEHYGDAARFEQAARAMPLQAGIKGPQDSVLDQNPPGFSITLAKGMDPSAMSCYASDQDQIKMQIKEQTVELHLLKPWTKGRARLNCTMQDKETRRWFWIGRQYIVP
ncbi:MAG: chitin deacetylase [Alphaproteobacteria bacterium]|nr:MAG: chitin deacetylase [Alphaproteobacteria bacterium]